MTTITLQGPMTVSRFGFRASLALLSVLDTLAQCTAGRFAAIMGYVPVSSKDWNIVPKYDATFTSRFDTLKLYQRKRMALEAITLEMLADAIAKEPKLSELSHDALVELFSLRKGLMLQSLDGTREDTEAHREGQARCHATAADGLPTGVRVHFHTVKGDDGLMHPVLVDGMPVAESIRLHAIVQSKRYTVKGERRKVNSGAPVLMSNAISSLLNRRSVSIASFTLRDNFDAVKVDGHTISNDDELYTPAGEGNDD